MSSSTLTGPMPRDANWRAPIVSSTARVRSRRRCTRSLARAVGKGAGGRGFTAEIIHEHMFSNAYIWERALRRSVDAQDQPFEVVRLGKLRRDRVIGRLRQPLEDLCRAARVDGGARDDFLE